MMPYTTLGKLREANACKDRYTHLRKELGKGYQDDTPISLIKILETNGLDDVLWIPEFAIIGDNLSKRYRLFAVACCQDILHLMKDERSRNAVKIAHLFAYGEASVEELNAARDAAWGAVWGAARFAVWGAAAWGAARAAAWDAASATRAATRAAASAAWERQKNHFKIIFSTKFESDE